jgi:hypothetical protein
LAPSPISRSSTFDSSNEGWIALAKLGRRPPAWGAVGGNPGGYITQVYDHTRFLSPGTWAGDALGDYGGRIQVDLKASGPGVHAVIGLSSTNSAAGPCLDTGELPQGWHTYSITLDASGLRCGGSSLTAAEVRAALVGFAGMSVSAPAFGPAPTVSLDNASLSGPQTPVTAPIGKVTRTLTLRRRGGVFRGTIVAADDYSCAKTMKVTIFRKAKKPARTGTATTDDPPNGESASFTLDKRVVKGSYYASVTKTKSPLDGNTCSLARSIGVKVR